MDVQKLLLETQVQGLLAALLSACIAVTLTYVANGQTSTLSRVRGVLLLAIAGASLPVFVKGKIVLFCAAAAAESLRNVSVVFLAAVFINGTFMIKRSTFQFAHAVLVGLPVSLSLSLCLSLCLCL
jgi:hypothetical protein